MAHIFSLLHVHCKKQFRYLPMSSFLSRLRRHKLLLFFLLLSFSFVLFFIMKSIILLSLSVIQSFEMKLQKIL